jgi:type II secretory pathway component GspD/PulD (secretin)
LIIDSRSAKTTVTCQDGHTIIVGGLITRKQQNLEDKVPILGDIPGIGLAFKSTKIIKGRTELLIILTPRVMRAPSDSDILTNKEVRQMHPARGMGTEASMGDLLNPLHGVTPAEVKRLEHGLPATQAASELEPVVIPLTPQERNSVVRERTSKENP